jgi:hypothetical protein
MNIGMGERISGLSGVVNKGFAEASGHKELQGLK